ncbi:MAG TPA: hypothetical protein EYP54_01495 [Anaerolineales bacterium]|nr:hypothetical protein [Anaerolineales bacterium]
MPGLTHRLRSEDLGFQRIVAETWGLPLEGPDTASAARSLAQRLPQPEVFTSLWQNLPAEARTALMALKAQGGRMLWAHFVRRFGPLREFGPARRDRERPDRHPISTTETLWYRALIGRAFLDTPEGPREFAYLPDEFLPLLPDTPTVAEPPGRPATPQEHAHPLPHPDLLNALTSLLAAQRLGKGESALFPAERAAFPPGSLTALARAAGLLDEQGAPVPARIKPFLTLGDAEALRRLFHAWRTSPLFDELHLLPHLEVEGAWERPYRRPREQVLAWLQALPEDWWSLEAFVQAVRQQAPDFARPAPGDFDSWYMRRRSDGQFLRGEAAWDEVDGALLRFLLTGPLHWFGAVDLAAPEPGQSPRAFRRAAHLADLLARPSASPVRHPSAPMQVTSDGRITVPRHAPRWVRYQIARATAWEALDQRGYHYRLTPRALQQARRQGLFAGQVLALLQRHAAHVPPNLVRALARWEEHGTQVEIVEVTVLQVGDPAILQALRRSPARRYLGPLLGPTAVVVPKATLPRLRAALLEMGYLVEGEE